MTMEIGMKERPSAMDSTRDDLDPSASNYPGEEEICFVEETELGTSEEDEITFIEETGHHSHRDKNRNDLEVHVEDLAWDYDSKDLPKGKSAWAEFIATKKEITTIFEMESDDSASYPSDCYSFISLNGPRVRYFWCGLMVFVFQMSFLTLMIFSVLDPRWKTGKVDDNPTSGTFADFIATEASPLVRGTQIVSLMASVIFVDASVMDIVTATQSFPRFSMATSKDNVWCIAFSCILRFTQGLFAVMVSLVLVFNSDSVIDIILNFTALNFISALDDVGFELAKIGKYGPSLEEEVKRIEQLPLPVCMYRKQKHVRFWYTIIPLATVLFGLFFVVVYMQENVSEWETHVLRVEISEETLQGFSGCYRNDFKRETDSYRRDVYISDMNNTMDTRFGFCLQEDRWFLYQGNESNPCDAIDILLRSSPTDAFDIETSFLEDWFTADGTPAELYFFEDVLNEKNLFCESFINNGKCDDDFNDVSHNFDGGDCCAATCTHLDCWRKDDLYAFDTNTTGFGYPNCKDHDMQSLIIQLNSFTSSHVQNAPLSTEKQTYIDTFVTDYYNTPPSDALLTLSCGDENILQLYINSTMVKKRETVKVQNGAECELRIENITSSEPSFTDDPIWYVNYTVYNGDEENKNPILCEEYSFGNGVTSFSMIPKCFFEKLPIESGMNMQSPNNPSSKAIRWLAEDALSTDCRYFFDQRYALAALYFAAPSKHKVWVEEKVPIICHWDHIVCVKNDDTAPNATDLLDLDISGLELSGSIATEIGLLNMLSLYDASDNSLSGSIPSEIGSLTKLSLLKLSDNTMSDSIPSEIGLLNSLQELFMERNNCTGSIPTEIGKLTNLIDLNIHDNFLTGSIPSEIGLLTSLTMLQIGGTNRFSGFIPSEIQKLENLKILYVNRNNLTGSLPSEIGSLTSLTKLCIDDVCDRKSWVRDQSHL